MFSCVEIDWLNWQACINPDLVSAPAWVQALGTVIALAIAIYVPFNVHRRETLDRNEREIQEVEKRRQLLLSALYVEVFAFAIRSARDAETWGRQAVIEANRAGGNKGVRTRDVRDLLKFEPITPVVYPAAALNYGLLEPEAQATLNEFYYRVDAIARDIHRFALNRDANVPIPGVDVNHLALLFYDSCETAQKVLAALRNSMDNYASLDEKMTNSYRRSFVDPSPLGSNIDDVLYNVLKNRKVDRPSKDDSDPQID